MSDNLKIGKLDSDELDHYIKLHAHYQAIEDIVNRLVEKQAETNLKMEKFWNEIKIKFDLTDKNGNIHLDPDTGELTLEIIENEDVHDQPLD